MLMYLNEKLPRSSRWCLELALEQATARLKYANRDQHLYIDIDRLRCLDGSPFAGSQIPSHCLIDYADAFAAQCTLLFLYSLTNLDNFFSSMISPSTRRPVADTAPSIHW
jgi:hypothetical protein